MTFYDILLSRLPNELIADIVYYLLITLGLLFVCIIANYITKRFILRLITKIISSNNYKWDDILLDSKAFHRAALVVPGIIIYIFAGFYNDFQSIIQKLAIAYILIVISLVIKSLLDALDGIYRQHPVSKERPIKGLLQIIEIAIYIIIGITVISNIINQNPIYMLSGIGAVTAVVSLIFKDIIIGFVSGIQLTWNDMLRIGDWVEMPKYGADGDVIDITLNTVKIQNFDKTISTIPTQAFVTDSFKNWRGMKNFGARRIKRSVFIDMYSVKICTDEMIERFKKIEYLSDYINEKSKEIQSFNKDNNINTALPINGRQLTNLGVFRIYILNYIKNNIKIYKGTLPMVRQLAPGENGIPIEIYAFVSTTEWANYENVQADIFDHILAVMDYFELKVFQNPTGYDIKQLQQR
jgi:miniconductance mechanosensitive channel